jgi:hypothetical protein
MVISPKSTSKVKSVAELAILEPFLATVKEVADAVPVPSLIPTVSPALGVAGKVIVMLPAVTTITSPETAV